MLRRESKSGEKKSYDILEHWADLLSRSCCKCSLVCKAATQLFAKSCAVNKKQKKVI